MSHADRVLLIGAGFMGSAFARQQLAAGTKLAILTRHGAPDLEKLGVRVVVGGQENFDAVASLLPQFGTVVHFACPTNPALSHANPALEVREHLAPFRGFLDAASSYPPQKFIFVSSGGTVYGNPAYLPASEILPAEPLSPHGQAKFEAERMVRQFADAHGVQLVILRPANIYGPGQKPRPGFGVVPTLLNCVATGQAFKIQGNSVRDYVYIDDMVAALHAVVAKDDVTGTFNVGTGQGTSVRQLIEIVQQVSGVALNSMEHPMLPGAVQEIYLDAVRLTAATGWRPIVSMENGIDQTWRWMRDEAGYLGGARMS